MLAFSLGASSLFPMPDPAGAVGVLFSFVISESISGHSLFQLTSGQDLLRESLSPCYFLLVSKVAIRFLSLRTCVTLSKQCFHSIQLHGVKLSPGLLNKQMEPAELSLARYLASSAVSTTFRYSAALPSYTASFHEVRCMWPQSCGNSRRI